MRIDEDDSNRFKLFGKDEGNDYKKKILEKLFSKSSLDILQNTDIKKEDVYWLNGLIILKQFVVNEFCYDKERRNIVQNTIDEMLLSRISLDRGGRKEWFETMKTETQIAFMKDMRQGEQILK